MAGHVLDEAIGPPVGVLGIITRVIGRGFAKNAATAGEGLAKDYSDDVSDAHYQKYMRKLQQLFMQTTAVAYSGCVLGVALLGVATWRRRRPIALRVLREPWVGSAPRQGMVLSQNDGGTTLIGGTLETALARNALGYAGSGIDWTINNMDGEKVLANFMKCPCPSKYIDNLQQSINVQPAQPTMARFRYISPDDERPTFADVSVEAATVTTSTSNENNPDRDTGLTNRQPRTYTPIYVYLRTDRRIIICGKPRVETAESAAKRKFEEDMIEQEVDWRAVDIELDKLDGMSWSKRRRLGP
jgi:hypothetical protein